MGNIQSNKNINLLRLIDSIASKYILTQNFKDLQNLHYKDYCDKLIILTSDILASRFNIEQIQFLDKRTQQGDIINSIDKDNILYINKNQLNKLDVQSSVKKKRMCIGIAKFYIKIAHLFSAIVSTINPQYSYRDNNNNIVKAQWNSKNINNINKFNLSKINLCSRRINSTIINQIKNNDGSFTDNIQLKSKICNINKNNNTTKTLNDEPGIPELKQLYFDIYNYDTGKFIAMSENSKNAYYKDLELFYKTFTGNKNMPSNIHSFNDIKLRDFHNKSRCYGNNAPLKQYINLNIKNNLYKKYAEQLRIMTIHANNNREQLLKILNQVFVYRVDPETKNKEVTLHPNLNMKLLDKLVSDTRKIVIKLYIDCENDFLKIINLFEAVVEEQIKKNTLRKIDNIKNQKTKYISQ
jgi:hypothetical protein